MIHEIYEVASLQQTLPLLTTSIFEIYILLYIIITTISIILFKIVDSECTSWENSMFRAMAEAPS